MLSWCHLQVLRLLCGKRGKIAVTTSALRSLSRVARTSTAVASCFEAQCLMAFTLGWNGNNNRNVRKAVYLLTVDSSICAANGRNWSTTADNELIRLVNWMRQFFPLGTLLTWQTWSVASGWARIKFSKSSLSWQMFPFILLTVNWQLPTLSKVEGKPLFWKYVQLLDVSSPHVFVTKHIWIINGISKNLIYIDSRHQIQMHKIHWLFLPSCCNLSYCSRCHCCHCPICKGHCWSSQLWIKTKLKDSFTVNQMIPFHKSLHLLSSSVRLLANLSSSSSRGGDVLKGIFSPWGSLNNGIFLRRTFRSCCCCGCCCAKKDANWGFGGWMWLVRGGGMCSSIIGSTGKLCLKSHS